MAKVLNPVRPNAGIALEYRRKLVALVEEMARSYAYWIKARYRASPPRMALDATPAEELERELRKLGDRWQKRIDAAAPELAKWFAQKTSKRSEKALMEILRKGGLSVRRLKFTPRLRDVMEASIAENVALIKSIGSEFHSQIEGSVMRSVQVGRDLDQLSKDLRKRYGVTKRRAELIARDQNNKATAVLTRTRHMDLGIKKAVWLHSHAGKKPRRTHLKNDGKKYDVAEGWYDPDPKVQRRIWPGELINCRCVSKPIVEGFS